MAKSREKNIASLTGLIVGDQAETEEIAVKSKIAARESKTKVRKMKCTKIDKLHQGRRVND